MRILHLLDLPAAVPCTSSPFLLITTDHSGEDVTLGQIRTVCSGDQTLALLLFRLPGDGPVLSLMIGAHQRPTTSVRLDQAAVAWLRQHEEMLTALTGGGPSALSVQFSAFASASALRMFELHSLTWSSLTVRYEGQMYCVTA